MQYVVPMAQGLQKHPCMTFHHLKSNTMALHSQLIVSGILPGEQADASIPVPVHERDTWQGSEFLDDQIRTDEAEEDITHTQTS